MTDTIGAVLSLSALYARGLTLVGGHQLQLTDYTGSVVETISLAGSTPGGVYKEHLGRAAE